MIYSSGFQSRSSEAQDTSIQPDIDEKDDDDDDDDQRALVVMWMQGWTSKREAMGSNPTVVINFGTFF